MQLAYLAGSTALVANSVTARSARSPLFQLNSAAQTAL